TEPNSGAQFTPSTSQDLASPAVALHAELVAVVVAVTQGMPRVLVRDADHALPAGPFQFSHRSLQAGLRAWVEEQTHHPLGYVEQLYTFADRDRASIDRKSTRLNSSHVKISYAVFCLKKKT